MKKRRAVLGVLLALSLAAPAGRAEVLTVGASNDVYFRNFENLYNAVGQYKAPGSQVVPGDHLVGIINAQNVTADGTPAWFQSPTDQITGVLAQRVEAVFYPDAFDPVQVMPHLVLGPPAATTFCKGTDCFSTATILGPGEMIAFFRQTGTATEMTLFEYNGSLADDVAKASDGARWLTVGYGGGLVAAPDGYFYSHVSLGAPLLNFTGEAWGGLNAIVNNTGHELCGINDPNESELGGDELLNSLVLSSELEGNPDSIYLGRFSPWDYRSNDPATVLPCVCGASIGDRVWADSNGNGLQDVGEVGIPGVMVNLLDSAGAAVATTTTDSNGFYLFGNLCAGTYRVEFVPPTGYIISPLDLGSDDAVDSDANPADGRTAPITLSSGEADPTWDAGMYQPASLGDRVWKDLNLDGVQNEAEPAGFEGIVVNLYKCDGTSFVDSTTTDDKGYYLFDDLAPGGYIVEFVPPGGWELSPKDAGTEATDSDAGPDGRTDCITLVSGQTDLTWDAGLHEPAAPEIKILKATNGDPADTPTGPLVLVGDPVTWAYEVYNTGSVPLKDIVVTDNELGSICSIDYLDIGEMKTCTADGTATAGQYANRGCVDGTAAWGDPVTVSDCNWSHYFGALPAIDIEKATNGDDADLPTGPEIPVGGAVTWTYVVTNTGNVNLTNVTVADDMGVVVTCLQSTLAVGESMTCTATGTAVIGQYENMGTATGTWTPGKTVTDEDPSHYFGASPKIDIEKSTNGDDADLPPGPSIPIGGQVDWTYVVTNTGNVDLANVAVTDDRGVTVTCPATTLAVGASMTCTATGTAVAGQYANIGTATGTWNGTPVTDTDPSHYFGATPGISIVKSTNGDDANDPTGPFVPVGGAVSWTYLVTNTGAVALTSVTVTDDQGVTVTCPKTTLDVAETMTCTAEGIAVAGQYANVGTATGTPPAGPNVTATDPSHYFGSAPAIDIVKKTNGDDANDAPGPEIPVGGAVTWTYIVANTGNVALTNVTVTDDMGVTVTCPQTTLAALESMTCMASGTAVAGQYANVGTATGTPPVGPNVTDTDPSHYYGTTPTGPGTGTPGYWKNHPEAWPVPSITIGGTVYSRDDAIRLMSMPDGDKTFTLFRALVCAKLNVLVGNDGSCVADTIVAADAWMAAHPVGSGVRGSSDAWKVGEPLYLTLDAYNNGLLCAPHRDSVGTSVPATPKLPKRK